jgi:mannose-6-phosphate isomerase-like protein (cupin superfamily)
MARRATPRPEYDRPTVIRSAEVVRHLWGDEESGFVGDEVLLSSQLLHGLIFTLPPGGRFGHSPDNRTVFAADEVYAVLQGTIAVVDPASGQVCRAEASEFVVFGRDTWHHGINWGTTPVRVLELFAPPPATGASSAYARTVPYLEQSRYAEDGVLGRWPAERAAVEAASRLALVTGRDLRWRAEGDLHVGLVCSTGQLTVTSEELLPGGRSELRRHGGDAFFHVTAGVAHVHAPENDGPSWFQVLAGDSFAIPAGTPYRLVNQGAETLRHVLGAAPEYLAS